jgi:hypothetical protein
MRFSIFTSVMIIILFTCLMSQVDGDFTMVRAEVDFSKTLQIWDGFGVNYVETAQTIDYTLDPQDLLTYEMPSRSATTFFAQEK